MTTKTLINGRVAIFDGEDWRYDDGSLANSEAMCHKCGKQPFEFKDGKKSFYVDACIAHLVTVLNVGGLKTVASCCGHKRMPGSVILEDGRVIVEFKSLEEANEYVFSKQKYTIYGELINEERAENENR